MNDKITLDELMAVSKKTPVLYTDADDECAVPFIQANTFTTVIDLMSKLKSCPMTYEEIASYCNFEERQSSYYYNAGNYLGLFYKHENKVYLTKLGKKIIRLSEKERNLELVSCMLRHQIFSEMFSYITTMSDKACLYGDNERITLGIIKNRMSELNVCNQPLIDRRASSVLNWLKWIFELI